jgi:hypothetical protein
MSRNLSRRDLFGVFRRRRSTAETAPSEPAPAESDRPARGGFSLDDLYRRRAADGADRTPLPRFELRPGLERLGVGTTSVGVPELRRRRRRR